ncbi:MAG: formyltransferase family protein [Chloroflexota bacterium]
MENKPLRIVTFNFLPVAFQLVHRWIEAHNHKLVLAVTTPGPKLRPTPSYTGVVTSAPRDVDVLVTTRLRKVATPLIRELEPDLIMCLSFPYRITPEICAIPRYGAINLHPAPLPAYRGPNVMRPFYDGWHEYGATVHWIAPDYDTGNILSRKAAPMPEVITSDAVFPTWGAMMSEALAEGAERALAGDPGTPQDDSQATYAAPFSREERWVDWDEDQLVILRKVTALNMMNPANAKTMIDYEPYVLHDIELMESVHDSSVAIGTCIEQGEDFAIMQVRDGLVRANVEPLSA